MSGLIRLLGDANDGSGEKLLKCTTDGELLMSSTDPLSSYKIQDEDSDSVVKYFGFAASDTASSWYILKQDTTTNPYTYRYAGLSNNSTKTDYGSGLTATGAWFNRTTLTYGYLYSLTGL